MTATRAVLFDYSGTLFRLEEDDSWFSGMEVDERAVDGHLQAELMRRLTAPTGRSVDMDDGAAGAELADRADLADRAHGERARPQADRVGVGSVVHRHVAGQGVDGFHAHFPRRWAAPSPGGA